MKDKQKLSRGNRGLRPPLPEYHVIIIYLRLTSLKAYWEKFYILNLRIHTDSTELFRKEFLSLRAVSGSGLSLARTGSHLNVLLEKEQFLIYLMKE